MAATSALVLAAVVDVPAGGDVAQAIASARAGDVIRLGPGEHHASLGRRHGPLRIEGAGVGVTEVIAPEGEDALVVEAGEVELAGLALRAGRARSALKVLGGRAVVEDAVLAGGEVGAFVQGGGLEGRRVDLFGRYALLARESRVDLTGGTARGDLAGVALLSGALVLRRFAVTGRAEEAGITIAGGEAELDDVVVRSPGPSGIAVTGAGVLRASAVDVAGATEVHVSPAADVEAILGDCLHVRRGTAALSAATLTGCGGAAVEASGGSVTLRGVDAVGGEAGCLVLVDAARAELVGNVCSGRGPSVVAASGAQAVARMNRWRTDPVLWVDCGSGARVTLGRGERVAEPCRPGR
ncbi:hypothetical protein [Anaeromyxobacter oryzae]|uniref:Lipoprotein n=1 Tax=Anaeromyxobacter oryzae TaxID=2918170 RepID=A0ABM7WSR0_9BACT|nr:hypothetical protein [Anaeromyxobacter oryzae]BDG02520.1 hypothetical protein AMOR_15160 [Anaeromyxobacter oryzae]